MKKIFMIYTTLTILVLNRGFVFSQENESPILETLIKEALDNNPKIRQAFNEWKAAEHKIHIVKSLDNPKATFTYFGKNIETRVGPQKYKYGVSQKIPYPGKLRTKGKIQIKKTQIIKETYGELKREIIKDIKSVYFDIFWVDKTIEVTEEEKNILESLEKVTQKKYESNLASQQDVIKTQLEISKLIDKLLFLKQKRESLVTKMNSLLNRERNTPINIVFNIKPVDFTHTRGRLHELSKNFRHELLSADLEIKKVKHEKSLAYQNYLPDFILGFEYIHVESGHSNHLSDGEDAWMAMLSLNLPLWFNKLSAQVKEKEAQIEAAKNNYRNIKNDVFYEIDDLYFKILSYQDIISLYETALIPQAEQAFQTATARYETSQLDFLNWLDTERTILTAKKAYYKAIAEHRKSIARLEKTIGKDLQ
jgi:outer membrane protein TolC